MVKPYRQLGTANADSAKSIEKLSSGYRINRAGDDAAGLAISEKMRGQIRGLNQASSNAQDGISLIQTAEGALNETHAILQRMRELSVQAASDTNVTADRSEIQKELTQLTEEIDRIATTTEFNTMKLVNGESSKAHVTKAGVTTEGTAVKVTTAVDQTIAIGKSPIAWGANSSADFDISIAGKADNGFDWSAIDAAETNELVITKAGDDFKLSFAGQDGTGKTLEINADLIKFDVETDTYSYNNQGINISFTSADAAKWADTEAVTVDLAIIGADATGTHNTVNNNVELVVGGTDGDATFEMSAVTVTEKGALQNVKGMETVWDEGTGIFTVTMELEGGETYTTEHSLAVGDELKYSENGIEFTFKALTGDTNAAKDATITGTFTFETAEKTVTPTTTTAAETEDKSLKFQVGANENQSISLSIEDMGSKALAVDAIKVDSHDSAKAAITTINDAIEKVSSERSKLGAVQNRLEHTIKNLDTSSENLQASESRIRDVDMAKEMMEQTKQNILAQASTAMLAQANQAPQAVLQLLR